MTGHPRTTLHPTLGILCHAHTQTIHRDVLAALGHNTSVPLPLNFKPVYFSSCPDTILIASFAAYKILVGSRLVSTNLFLDPALRLRFVSKLLHYLARTGRQTPGDIHDFISHYAAPIADVLIARPRLASGKCGIAAIIRQIPRDTRFKALCNYFEKHYPTKPRPVIWTNRQFYLEQLTTNSHVLFQGLYHRNCLAGTFSHCLDKHGLPKRNGSLPSLQSLHYWSLMKCRQVHLLSFSDHNHQPLATLSLYAPLNTLYEAYGPYNRKLTGNEYYFPSLLQAIGALSRSLPKFQIVDDLLPFSVNLSDRPKQYRRT